MRRGRNLATWLFSGILMAIQTTSGCGPHGDVDSRLPLKWSALPSLPDREGFASMYAGVADDRLIVAGGANFPGKRPWEGGTKVWYDRIFALDQPGGEWQAVGALPHPAAYGLTFSFGNRLILVGGSDSKHHFQDVYSVAWGGSPLHVSPLSALPRPCANAAGVLMDRTAFVVGGIDRPDATECLNTFWSLDLGSPEATWQSLPPCPGKPRMLPVVGQADGAIYVFGGTSLSPGADGKPVRTYLTDAYRYSSAGGWTRLPDMPRAAVAAASPAPSRSGKLLVVSGDDGLNVTFKPETAHPGFPRDVLAFDIARGAWSVVGPTPFSRATVPAVLWKGRWVFPSGEARPGYRSPEVWSLE